jgi:GNAT superfamily N-acetyltransferase
MSDARIRPFRSGDEDAFRRINEAWITRYFAMEEADREALDDPHGHILDRGGAILIAEEEDEAVGCVALIPEEPGVYELAKMGVMESSQGRGLGGLLMQAAIEAARAMGASRIVLETNSRLQPALRLYERAGFVRVPHPGHSVYVRSEIRMELAL